MNKLSTFAVFATVALLFAAAHSPLCAATDETLKLVRTKDALGFLKPVPVNVSGFTGEADSVLKNDLLFMGVQHVPIDQAQYLITGSAAGRVEGRLADKPTKTLMLNKAYNGGSTRQQIHAFADDIAKALTGLPGIAQTKMAFKAEKGPGRSEIYIADFDGFGAQAVTSDNNIVSDPEWRGRDMLVYSSYKLGGPHIFSHHLTSGARNPVARHPGGNYSPAVSPDGSKVAMILSKGGSPDLYVANIDGSGLRQLTKTRESESSPCWSPDGKTICYGSRERGATLLFTISAAGGAPRHVVHQRRADPDRAGLVAGRQVDRVHLADAQRFQYLHRPGRRRRRHRARSKAKIRPGRPIRGRSSSAAGAIMPNSCLYLTCPPNR
jgi:hypothetical protein